MITAGSCNAIQASAPIIMLQDPPPKAFQRIRHSKSLARHTQQHRRCCLRTPPCAVATQGTARPETRSSTGSQDTEVIVIGSGIGGLSCAAMLANYGVKVSCVSLDMHAHLIAFKCHLHLTTRILTAGAGARVT